ncbi:hypothetical protein DL768_003514 [Monosporascus sp. mg162]|nr:hypothetical protein DL768_003514 [Monosporascus sp. mg162]
MGSFMNRFAGLSALFAAAVYAQDFNISTQYHEGGQLLNSRVWYGDGNLYVGAKVPASIQTAFNITIPNVLANPLYIAPVESAVQLPEGTFLAVNNATDAKDPALATQDASALGPEHTLNWVRWGTLLLPHDGTFKLDFNFYLGETDEPGTSVVRWSNAGTDVEGRRVNLTATLTR